ncbi:MAG: immunity 17 family protein [Clostridiales bacterium]|jgi:small neutral amino acid transporter SnatA (MarC family)|nr:immunity 17 family protein [Clostridiales bacterium]
MSTAIILIIMGLFSAICAAMDFNWFMENRKAAFFVRLIGRGGARIFYIVLGVILITFGVVSLFVLA